ncbi:MAG: SDR family oxidoreductase [Bacteroidetes bacterium]|nr:MAG: SDR family oxidoreductase [Bacteroidota bacterium]
MNRRHVLITGASGYLGSQLVKKLSRQLTAAADGSWRVVAMDVRPVPLKEQLPGIEYLIEDVRAPHLDEVLEGYDIGTVIHLAAIVNPGRYSNRQLEYSVDVLGTRNLLEACVRKGVKRLVVTSSGAAYGYHRDNPSWLYEDAPLRGNEEFAYAHHKRLVEEMLQRYRQIHPELEQVVFRVSTILGKSVRNQITAMLDRPLLPRLPGNDSPFVFIWDEDMVNCLCKAIDSPATGVFNAAGDGALSIREVARIMGKRCLILPAWFLRMLYGLLKALKKSRYGGEIVKFLQYRPVLANQKLKQEYGYTPMLSSREVLELFARARGYLPAGEEAALLPGRLEVSH